MKVVQDHWGFMDYEVVDDKGMHGAGSAMDSGQLVN
jgi:hypothetical protein